MLIAILLKYVDMYVYAYSRDILESGLTFFNDLKRLIFIVSLDIRVKAVATECNFLIN